MPRFFLATCCLLAALFVMSCSGDDSDAAFDLRLGVVQSLTGSASVYGPSALEGMQLAVEQIQKDNSKASIDLISVDDKSTIEGGMSAYQSLKAQDVDAIMGPSLSTIGFEVLRYANENQILAISPITTASGIAQIGDYVFRIALAEEVSLPALVEHVSSEKPIRSAVIFVDSRDAYSRSAGAAMRKGISAAGGSIAREVNLSTSPNLDQLFADPTVRAADAFFLPLLVDQAGPVLKALKAANIQKPVLGGEALASASLAEQVGDAVNGMYVSSTWHPDENNSLSREFVKAYKAKFGHDPEHFAAESHAGVYVLIDAVKRAKSTEPSAVREALAATKDLDTVLGKLSMSPDGDATFEPVFQRFENGKLVLIK